AGSPDPAGFAWTLTPELVLPLIALAALYALGGWRLRRGRPPARAPWGGGARPPPRERPPWRLAAGVAGWLALTAALLSPVAALGHVLFAAHMTQHLLLMAVAAPLLLLANPLPAVLWGLPRPLRHWLGRRLVGGSRLRVTRARLTGVPVA